MRAAGLMVGMLGLVAVAGCSSTKDDDKPGIFRTLVSGTMASPEESRRTVVQTGPVLDPGDPNCPAVGVMEGGSAIQSFSGGTGASALRSQITLGQLARECVLQADGSVLVKVGVEGRALLGVVGGGGRYNVPVRVVVRSGDVVIANRVRQAAIAIPAGDTHGFFALVEDGIVVPRSIADNFEIEVGLGGAASGQGRRRG